MNKDTSNANIESRAIYMALAGALGGFGVGVVLFFGSQVSLFERGISLGFVASILGGVVSLLVYIFTAFRHQETPATSRWAKVRRNTDIVSLAFVQALLVFLSYALIFYIIGQSFRDAHIDVWGASSVLALSTGFAAYVAYLMAVKMNTVRVATILALFLLSGTFISMMTASNPHWWNDHFSSLGAGGGVSGYSFNATLIVAGLVIIALSKYITDDFRKLQQTGRIVKKVKANIIQILLAGIGVALAFVGLFVYDAFPLIHNTAAFGMAFLFGVIILLLPWLVPGFTVAFFLASYGLIAALLASAWLFWGIGYFNLTVFELVAAAIIFIWLVIFVRHIAALLQDESHVGHEEETPE